MGKAGNGKEFQRLYITRIAYAKSQGERMKLDCVRCNKCGKIHSVEKGCDLPEAEASAERISSVIRSARELVNFGDWILASKIQLCDKRCLMQNIETDFGKVKSNQCDRESCPELVFKLLLDNVRAHF